MNPMTALNHGVWPNCSAISIPGAKRDQKLAAIITPAAKPKVESINLGFIVFDMNTNAAPAAVMPHVNKVANSAWVTG